MPKRQEEDEGLAAGSSSSSSSRRLGSQQTRPPSFRSSSPFLKVLRWNRYGLFTRAVIEAYLVILLFVLLLDDLGMLQYATVFYWATVVLPHLAFFVPMNAGFLLLFPRRARRALLFNWKQFLIEQVLQVLILLTAVPVAFGYVHGSHTIIHAGAAVAAALSIPEQMACYFNIDEKRQMVQLLESGTEGEAAEEGTARKQLISTKSLLQQVRSSMVLSVPNQRKELNLTSEEDVGALEDKCLRALCPACNTHHPVFLCQYYAEKLLDDKTVVGINKESILSRRRDQHGLNERIQMQLESSALLGVQPLRALRTLLRLYGCFPCLSIAFAITAVVTGTLVALLPVCIGWVVSAFTGFGPGLPLRLVMIPCAFLAGNFLLQAAFGSGALYTSFKVGSQIETMLKKTMFRQVCGCSDDATHSSDGENGPSSCDIHTLAAGDLTSRFSVDITSIGSFIMETVQFDVSAGCISYIVSVAVLAHFDWRMGLFFAISVPVNLFVQSHSTVKETTSGNNNHGGRVLGRFQNVVNLRRTLKLYNSGDFVWSKTSQSIDDDLKTSEREAVNRSVFVAAIYSIADVHIVLLAMLLVFIAATLARSGTDAVMLVSTGLAVICQSLTPINKISRGGQKWLSIVPALHRIDELLPHKKDSVKSKANGTINDSPGRMGDLGDSNSLTESLELRGVKYRYPNAEVLALKGVDATFGTGNYYCIVGGSGSGKTTLLSIITREVNQTVGKVLADGREKVSPFGEELGVVFQESAFLHGSIAENVRIGKPSATDEEVRVALERAQCTEFVLGLPDGPETPLGGEDVNLSGGQAQRISLARALVRTPRLLVLDEATSALDPSSERSVIETVASLAKNDGILVISVTHRLDTTDACDEILVLRDGLVAEHGRPEDMNKECTLFSTIRNGDG